MFTISDPTWRLLVSVNDSAVRRGWAESGVFATGIGPKYQIGGPASVLYVGKSAGPKIRALGSGCDQATSSDSSTKWMLERHNKSTFWQMIERIDPTRQCIAWTNVSKMDQLGGERPPLGARWKEICNACNTALAEELRALSPRVTLFVTSGMYPDVFPVLNEMGYCRQPLSFDDGWTTLLRAPGCRYAIETRHPQGWPKSERDRVIDLTKQLMSN